MTILITGEKSYIEKKFIVNLKKKINFDIYNKKKKKNILIYFISHFKKN